MNHIFIIGKVEKMMGKPMQSTLVFLKQRVI